MKTISLKSLDTFTEKYIGRGGLVHVMREGVLMNGDLLFYDPTGKNGLKTFVVKEIPINSWNSVQSIRGYNKCPKKYEKIISNI